MQQAEGKGRIIALRVSDADFDKLEGLKRSGGMGWNQLLLEPAETAYGLTLESAHPAKRKAEEAEPAETSKKKGGRKKAESPAAQVKETAPEVVDETKTETEG